jgi:hypothetical protein
MFKENGSLDGLPINWKRNKETALSMSNSNPGLI